MRYVPEQTITCHVCGTKFTLHTRWDEATDTIVSTPKECPACDAPIVRAQPIDIGHAKGWLLTFAGVSWYVREFGDARRYLERHTRTEEDVDAYLRLVDEMDWDAWEKDERAIRKPSADERETRKVLPGLRADAASGTLRRELEAVAAPVRDELRAARAKHLAIFEERRRGG